MLENSIFSLMSSTSFLFVVYPINFAIFTITVSGSLRISETHFVVLYHFNAATKCTMIWSREQLGPTKCSKTATTTKIYPRKWRRGSCPCVSVPNTEGQSQTNLRNPHTPTAIVQPSHQMTRKLDLAWFEHILASFKSRVFGRIRMFENINISQVFIPFILCTAYLWALLDREWTCSKRHTHL